MWRLRRPSRQWLATFRDRQTEAETKFAGFADDNAPPPPGFRVDWHRAYLGNGDAAFEAGCRGVREWRMMPEGWISAYPNEASIRNGCVVVVLMRALGAWWPNACRIVQTFDRSTPTRRFGFVYATLPSHIETGQERFAIVQDEDGSVWYEILAHSRPRYWAARLLWPVTRLMQRRFMRDSQRQMQRYVAVHTSCDEVESSASTAETRRVAARTGQALQM